MLITPDDLWGCKNGKTFLFAGKRLIIKRSTWTHYEIAQYKNLIRKYDIRQECFCGRTGSLYGKNYVSFWQFSTPCYEFAIRSLLKKGIINKDYVISSPHHEDVKVKDFLNGIPSKINKSKAWWDAALKLHLMNGDAKKKLMKKLGVGRSKLTKNKWRAKMMEMGFYYYQGD